MTIASAATEPPASQSAGGGCNYKRGGAPDCSHPCFNHYSTNPTLNHLSWSHVPKPQNETELDRKSAHVAPRSGPHHNIVYIFYLSPIHLCVIC